MENNINRYRDRRYKIDKNFLPNSKRCGEIRLYQLGRIYCNEDTEVYAHTHIDFFELTVVTGGSGTVITNGQSFHISKGDIYVSFPGDFHSIISDAWEPLKYDCAAFQTDNGRIRRDMELIMSDFHSGNARVIHSETVSSLVANALAEIISESDYSDKVLESIFTQIFAYIIRAFRNAKPVKQKYAGEAEVLCYQIMNYIDTHIYVMKSLNVLSEEFSYSYNYISNLFKRVTSDTLANYFRNRRLETARLILSEGTIGVTATAALLNYSSVYIFSRAFKEKYGVPPSEVRRAGMQP